MQHWFAHSANKHGERHLLRCHLAAVQRLAGEFAHEATWHEEAQLAGALHDLGKYGELFQQRLAGAVSGIDHWSAGAWIALTQFRAPAAALAIQGHHVGLQVFSKAQLGGLEPSCAKNSHPFGLRVSDPDPSLLFERAEADCVPMHAPAKRLLQQLRGSQPVADMLDVRILFSTLVDADFLDTEAHFNADADGKRYRVRGPQLRAADALRALEEHRAGIQRASDGRADVNRARDELWDACLTAAAEAPGPRTLTAPTGFGKTLAMLGFALAHAERYGLERIVFVIPYLSIIEQTVKILTSIFAAGFGEDYVLEHHSLAGGGAEQARGDAAEKRERRRRLLAENWDAPIVVTTSVQLLESLFSNRPAACRKLHRLRRSVILFDEVQALPTPLAIATLAALSHLAAEHRATPVFATATQPAFTHLDPAVRAYGSPSWTPHEIAKPHLRLFDRRRRCRVRWVAAESTWSWEAVADAMAEHRQALCVVNLKRHAHALVGLLKERGCAGVLHLSTSMCPLHRADALTEMRRRLDPRGPGEPCLLVSTQCIEAGVDVDFPAAFRALAPLDSIVQAAGRCNREGKRPAADVFVFRPADEDARSGYPSRAYQQAAAVTLAMLRESGAAGMDIDDPELLVRYWRRLYSASPPAEAAPELHAAIRALDFPEVARLYRLIDQDTVNVVVPYAEADALFAEIADTLRQDRIDSRTLRRAQRLAVPVHQSAMYEALAPFVTPVDPGERARAGWYVYEFKQHYDAVLGLVPPRGLEVLTP